MSPAATVRALIAQQARRQPQALSSPLYPAGIESRLFQNAVVTFFHSE